MPGRVPQASPPPGVVPNYDHPRDSGRAANLAFQILTMCMVSIFCSIRFYVRLFIRRKLEVSDGTCFLAWMLILLYSCTVLIMTHYGMGYHSWELREEPYTQVLRWLYASSIIYIPVAYFTRVTILLMIAHVFSIDPRITRAIYYLIAAITLTYAPVQGVKIFVCNPIKKYWDPNVTGGRCIDQRPIFVVDTCIAIITDLIIVILPIPLTIHLDLARNQKVKIILMLGAGGAATTACIYRLVRAIQYLNSTDVTGQFAPMTITPVVEISVGLSCACLPATTILYERLRSRWSSNNSSESDSKSKTKPRAATFASEKGGRIIRHWWKASNRIATSLVTRNASVMRSRMDNNTTTTTNNADTLPPPMMTQSSTVSIPNLAPIVTKTGQIVQPEDFGLEDWGSPLHALDGNRGILDGWLAPRGVEGPDLEYGRHHPALVPDWGDKIWDGSQLDGCRFDQHHPHHERRGGNVPDASPQLSLPTPSPPEDPELCIFTQLR